MKLSSRTREAQRHLELSTTGFIDVVFLLLIFFLVTSTFLLPERQMRSNVAVEEKDAAGSRRELEPAIIDVQLVDNVPTYSIGAFSTSDERQLNQFLADFINKQDGAFIRADDDVPFDVTARAIGACRINGFNLVTYVPGS